MSTASASYVINQPQRQRRRLRLGRLFAVAWRLQTYRNLCYLLASFPLGLIYFTFLSTALSVGLGTLIIGIGVPILLVTMVAWWGCAIFERELTIWWLGVDIRPLVPPPVAGLSFWKRLQAYLSNQATWTTLVYLVVKFPLGLLSFTLAVGGLALTGRLLASPLPYVIDSYLAGTPWVGVPFETYLLTALGLATGLGTLYLVNGLAWLSGHFARLMLGSGDVAQLTRQLSETTARAEREHAKAERAEQSRRELIVNVSHELRTPTASIRGHVESLLIALEERPDGGVPPAELRNYLTIIHRETERLGDLVNELVPLARAEAGELRLDVGPVDAAGVVEEVYQSLAPLARRERSITVVHEVAPGLPPVLADRGRLVQVLLNLVRNAVTYPPTGGIVSISLGPAGPEQPGRVALEVADTGIGIAPEDLERIFDRFYRTDASRARASGGFGLGLAIVRDLVSAMGGSVTAESTVGEGSRFRVLLRTAPEGDGNRQDAKSAKGMTSNE